MKKLVRLFWEFFKISLFVLGGGYAIIVVANEVFGRKLKWMKEGELLENLPIIQMVPGLIAGNSAIYVGLKTAGRIGACVALLAVALPSFVIFLAVSHGYSMLPANSPVVNCALLGLRCSITGLVFATLIKGWRKSVIGAYGYATFAVAAALLLVFKVNVVFVLLGAMVCGIVWKLCGGATPGGDDTSEGVQLTSLSLKKRIAVISVAAALIALVTFFEGTVFWTFVKFGFLGFGGGYALVPIYIQEFVGSSAAHLQLPANEFANLIALTQTTPGPISINAATFFGYKFDGVAGAAAATVGLLLPSLFLMTALLSGLSKWRENKVVRGLLFGVKPATSALIFNAGVAFACMSVIGSQHFELDSFPICPYPLAIATLCGFLLLKVRIPVMLIILIGSLMGLIAIPFLMW